MHILLIGAEDVLIAVAAQEPIRTRRIECGKEDVDAHGEQSREHEGAHHVRLRLVDKELTTVLRLEMGII